jgi:signal transduction histidine kinase
MRLDPGWRVDRVRRLAGALSVGLALMASHVEARQAAPDPPPAVAGESDDRPSILVLFAEDPSQPATQALEDGLSAAVTGAIGEAPVLYYEYLDATRFEEAPYREALERFFRDKYGDRSLDLIVAIGQSAIEFTARARDELWPGNPILFAATHEMTVDASAALPDASGLIFRFPFADALSAVRSILPDTRHVALISGSSALERARTAGTSDDVRRAGLEPIDLSGLTMAGILARVAKLPDHTIVFISGPLVDADGRATPARTLCDTLSSAANRPAFMAAASQFVGCGITGGKLRDFGTMGKMIGQRALAALDGTAPGVLDVPADRFTTLAFDARQLERWRIDESRLPIGSTVLFRRPSLWRDHRSEVLLVSAGLAIESLLILGLLYERRRRHRAELDSRRSLSLAAHVDRRSAMATLTGSIAHELNQPLSSILLNAEAAAMLVGSGRATREQLQEILGDIRNEDARATQIIQRHRAMLRKHELEKRALDIHGVVRESLALVSHDAVARQIEIDTDLPPSPCIVSGDQVLLQQVVVNLIINAMDAMKDQPPARRRVTVRSVRRADSVEISVSDRGPGLPPHVSARLFEPFVTTKPNGIGIGLSIARNTIEALDGTIRASNNPEGGASFRFTLRAAP